MESEKIDTEVLETEPKHQESSSLTVRVIKLDSQPEYPMEFDPDFIGSPAIEDLEAESESETAPELETAPKPEPDADDLDDKFLEMRSRYNFRPTPQRMPAIPPDISGNELKGICGIVNLGNTCYANSCLQILRAADDWTQYLVAQDLMADQSIIPDKTTKQAKVLIGFQDIIRVLSIASAPSFVRPVGWFNCVREAVHGTVYDMFGHPIPNDSHEYLVWLLDNLHESLLAKTDGSSSALQPQPSQDPWRNFLAKNNTPVADSFFGLLRKEVQCDVCRNMSISYEPFNILKIPCLDTGRPFSEWLNNFFTGEEFEDYACDSCKPTRTKAKISYKIWRAPRNLFIGVRRFDDPRRKNGTLVPQEGTAKIDICEVYHQAVRSAGPIESQYNLRGVVDHHGSHMGGHYTAQFYHPVTKRWWWMDDESAQYMAGGPRFGSSNYMFLFRLAEDGGDGES